MTKGNGVTTITFNRPEQRNAMSPQVHNEMLDLLTELRYDQETRVIVLTGAETSNLNSDRTIRAHGDRPGLEQFVQKQLRPVSGVMSLPDK